MDIPKCSHCKTPSGRYQQAMRRLYIKKDNLMVGVGWVCPKCGKVILERKKLE